MARKLHEIIQALGRPEAFFADRSGQWKSYLAPIGLLIALVTLALVATRLIGPADPAFMGEGALQGPANFMRNPTPAQRLVFPAYWAAIIAYGWLARYVGVRVFGETNRSAGDVLLVTMIGTLPMLGLSALLGITNQLAPYWWHRPDSVALALRMVANVVLFGCVYLWEAYIVVAGFRRLFGQNRGRAIFIWLSPAIGLLFCAAPTVIFLLVSLR